MFKFLKKRNVDDWEFVRLVVDEARDTIIDYVIENWPLSHVPSLGIPYCRYDLERLKRNWILFEDYAYKRNFKVEVIEGRKKEQYIRYTYLFYSPMKVE